MQTANDFIAVLGFISQKPVTQSSKCDPHSAAPAGTRPPPSRIPFTEAVDCNEWDAGRGRRSECWLQWSVDSYIKKCYYIGVHEWRGWWIMLTADQRHHTPTAGRVNWWEEIDAPAEWWCLTATSGVTVTVVTSHREITERQWRVNVRTRPTYGNTWRR